MKKIAYTNQIIRNIIILFFLLLSFKNNNGFMRYMIISFIMCLFISVIKNICLILKKEKYASIFSKLYVIFFLFFTLCFLIFWSYTVINQNNYIMLLFTMPFWLVEIHFFRKCFLKKTNQNLNKRKLKLNFIVIVPYLLVLTILIVGLFCLITGIKDTYRINKVTKNYLTTTAYLKDYELFSSSKERKYNKYQTDITYRLVYIYKVDHKEYTIKTDYGSGHIPKMNSIKKVKYNPNNPKKAVLIGMKRSNALIYFGIFFILGGMVFVLIFLQIKGAFKKIKIDVIGIYIGIVFTIIGIGLILIQNDITSSFIDVIKIMKFWILIPCIFIVCGILLTIKSLCSSKIKNSK